MTTVPRLRARTLLALSAVVVLLAGGAAALSPGTAAQKGVKPVTPSRSSWTDVDRLVGEQKYEEAAKAAESLLAAAKKRKKN